MTNAGRIGLIRITDLPIKQGEFSLRPTVEWLILKIEMGHLGGWGTWVIGHMGKGAHGQWDTWAMGYCG